jgi:acetate kinase
VRILSLNSGSSSLKFQVVDIPEHKAVSDECEAQVILRGEVKQIGGQATMQTFTHPARQIQSERPIKDHAEAVSWALTQIDLGKVHAVGHRVVHGGERYRQAIRIDADVVAEIEALSELAPLHNPACIAVIRGARQYFKPSMPMVAVFDTAFHATIPARASTYALPQDLVAKHGIRRFGFHGIAHAALVDGYEKGSGNRAAAVRLITLQLGNGCSAAAILQGEVVDTSMGFTPLEGLVMGTRSGDIDPAIVSYLAEREGVPPHQVEQWLNEKAGLLGVSGLSHDMKHLLEAERTQHARAHLAIEVFCYRVKKYMGAYLAVLGGADAVIFGGGIGEHAPSIRARVCEGMAWCGLRLDPERNARAVGLEAGGAVCISHDDARVAAYVVAVNEETAIAWDTWRVLRDQPGKS